MFLTQESCHGIRGIRRVETARVYRADGRSARIKHQAYRQSAQAACPTCKEGGEQAIVITPEKGLFYCFPGKKGGDAIELVGHVKV